jgi:hypothetical protein
MLLPNGENAIVDIIYGQRYTVDFEMTTEKGTAPVRSGWIILRGGSAPRLTTCYVLKRNRNVEKNRIP